MQTNVAISNFRVTGAFNRYLAYSAFDLPIDLPYLPFPQGYNAPAKYCTSIDNTLMLNNNLNAVVGAPYIKYPNSTMSNGTKLEFKNFASNIAQISTSSSTLYIDLAKGNTFSITLNDNITDVNVSNIFINQFSPNDEYVSVKLILFDNGSSHTITWGSTTVLFKGNTTTFTSSPGNYSIKNIQIASHNLSSSIPVAYIDY
jgi:hypothetical protein